MAKAVDIRAKNRRVMPVPITTFSGTSATAVHTVSRRAYGNRGSLHTWMPTPNTPNGYTSAAGMPT